VADWIRLILEWWKGRKSCKFCQHPKSVHVYNADPHIRMWHCQMTNCRCRRNPNG
jgi:hypothetical protein